MNALGGFAAKLTIYFLPIFSNFSKLEYTSAMFSFTEARGVMISENESFFGSVEVGLSQNDESQTKKITPVIEAEIIKAIIFFVVGDFFLNLSMKSNIIF